MNRTWSNPEVEIIPMRVDAKQYEQRVAELAEVVYQYLCQLCEDQNSVPHSFGNAFAMKWTGTDE